MAATLKHDAQGFLVGELIDGSRDILRAQEASLQVFRGMHTDVKSILNALKIEAGTPSFHAPAGRAPSGAAKAVGAMPAAQLAAGAIAATARATAVVSPAGRDDRGRFTAKAAGAPGRPTSDASAAGATSRLTSAVNRLSALRATPADNVDPTINALKEVTDVVGPLGRGLFSMFGRGAERKKERWYGRFLKALTPKGQDKVIVVSTAGGGLLGGRRPARRPGR